MKELPKHLKYTYLGDHDTLPVIIASDLIAVQEEKLLRVLREFKPAITWTLAYIKGINPSVCMHHILLDPDAKPVREHQRNLNPAMKEMVTKEILKLLELGIIFPISDSEWASPVHVLPKKIEITLVRNEKNELVPMRLQNGWRMCIDFRKLNATTRKDHFPPHYRSSTICSRGWQVSVSFAFLIATLGIIKLLLPKRISTKPLSLVRLTLLLTAVCLWSCVMLQ